MYIPDTCVDMFFFSKCFIVRWYFWWWPWKKASAPSGVDAIGVHIDVQPKDIQSSCPEHGEKIDGLCQCITGYVSDLEGGWVADLCADFEATICAIGCDSLTGEITYANEDVVCGQGKIMFGLNRCMRIIAVIIV